MDDLISKLEQILKSLFALEPIRNGKYVYSEIQELKQALSDYQNQTKTNGLNLLKALRAAIPLMEKWNIDLNTLKDPINVLVTMQQLPTVDWEVFLSLSNPSPRFQFNRLNKYNQQKIDFIPWISAKSGETFNQQEAKTQTRILIEHRAEPGFSQKLSAHLKKDPDFLVRLIMDSEHNFSKIAHSRLILYLSDPQLAKALIKHTDKVLQSHPYSLTQVEQEVNKLNKILSNGRSIATLLRNAEAKSLLDTFVFFQVYQSDAYNNRHKKGREAHQQEEDLKPRC